MPDNVPSPPAKPALDDLSFEDALAELEHIVHSLEAGRGTLADSISAYQRGALLRQHCERKLNEAEMKVQAIQQDGTGQAPTLRDITAELATGQRQDKPSTPPASPEGPQALQGTSQDLDDGIPF
ncbi:exodeoxyribonuclease VII small subunit [Formicincola oecophyllae]|uniref:Exodeoxyribonuclease 7 small subunit n=1 Tax=Formicincola oecophyllae TaxID=2558361 RepID=A0A4Y6U7U1_9PROT|nr:exodeoxyribonuclease VII small subunit [Formicincola oecophyllae]